MSRGEGSTIARAIRAADVNPPILVGVIAGAVVIALAYAAAMTGAVGPAKADPLTVDEVRQDFSETLAATQELVGGTWDARDDPFPRSCAELGASGQQIPALRIGAPAADPAAAAEAVEAAWTGWGYTVSQTAGASMGLEVIELQAEGEAGGYLILRLSDQASTLQGESACAPTP